MSLPRLEGEEATAWFAKVKAVPHNSPNFNCILPGCTNTYHTKQGLERHFIAIHMPKPDNPLKQTRAAIRPPSGPSVGRGELIRRIDPTLPNGRLKTRRKGRPPGPKYKARMREQGLLDNQSLASSGSTDRHIQTHHPAAHHGHGGDDEIKPREERSYLEFFPFLNTASRLYVVGINDANPTEPQSGATSGQAESAVQEIATKESSVKTEDMDMDMDNTAATASIILQYQENGDDAQAPFQEPDIAAEEISQDTVANENTEGGFTSGLEEEIPDTDAEADVDVDADGVSDPDVFFDAKGFPDSETDSSQKPSTGTNGTSHLPNGDTGNSALASITTENTGEHSEVDGDMDTKMDIDPKSSETTDSKTNTRQVKGISISTKPPSTGTHQTTLEPKTPMTLLPKSAFRLIPREDDDLEEYHLPAGHNVRYIEPTETELAERVEYDMDEQDEFWLKEINEDRRRKDLGEVSSSIFEKIFDRLEKEWFDLTKNMPKPTENLPPEDSACNICDDGECENSNAIVFCDGCNLAVHQEVGVANTVYMEPIDNIDKIPASRWKLTCYICKMRMGACIQCETKNCFRAFHVTCARKAHLYMKSKLTKVGSAAEALVYRAHCHKHTPRDHKSVVDLAGAAAAFSRKGLKRKRKARVIDDDSDDPDFGQSEGDDDTISEQHAPARTNVVGSRTSKAALAHQKHYTPGAPLAPMFIVNRLIPFVTKLTAKTPALKKSSALNFLYTICKYWSLKRESRRGAPLLKRLHLEPWTASATAHRQTEEEKLKKFQTLLHLRGDLERVRMLAELVRKRERAKLKRQELQNRYLCKIMFPLKTILEDTLTELEKFDKQKFFAYPILAEEVKDYHDVIKDPICFQTMSEKLNAHQYQSVEQFADDTRRIYKNCITYNKVDTPYYRSAMRQSKLAEPLLQKAKEDYLNLEINPRTGFLDVPIDSEVFTYNLIPFQQPDAVGDSSELESPVPPPPSPPVKETPLVETSVPKARKREASVDLPKVPFVSTRTLRTTKIRSAKSTKSLPATSSASTKSEATKAREPSKPSEKEVKALNQGPGFRAPSRSFAKQEVPKLKTATLTRADVARARQNGQDAATILEDEEEMLEKLRTKSKKSRSIAANLQSKLKPSILDKVVVINKPAPKGWAYVVVEGEESSDGEGEEAEAEVEEEVKATSPRTKK
ncbi:nuA3 HAT complex component nto1 [Mortierella antarctica]|nr:nuA3 HAT complex component nto1 [Mortierella antarctica]